MRILIYGLNYSPELTGIGKYTGEMCNWLVEQGHDVRVVCAPPYYPEWKVSKPYQVNVYKREQINGVKIFRCPLYVPKKPKTLTRLLHLLSFAFSSFPVVIGQWFWKPEVVITIEPTFFCTPAALILAKLSGAKCILHIQDYELDAMLGLGMGRGRLMSAVAGAVERWMMRRFDAISSISLSMVAMAKQKLKRQKTLLLFPNWVDINFVTSAADVSYYRDLWQVALSTKVVLYAGNIGKKQGLELVIHAADQLRHLPDVLFVMVGSGAAYDDLKRQTEQLGLTGIRFYPLQPYERLPSLMALADVHLVVQKKGVADAVLPSKLTTIFSAGGNALITAEQHTELGLLCRNFPGIAECVETENANAFVDALSRMLACIDVNDREPNYIAREYAIQFLSKEAILARFEKDLKALTARYPSVSG